MVMIELLPRTAISTPAFEDSFLSTLILTFRKYLHCPIGNRIIGLFCYWLCFKTVLKASEYWAKRLKVELFSFPMRQIYNRYCNASFYPTFRQWGSLLDKTFFNQGICWVPLLNQSAQALEPKFLAFTCFDGDWCHWLCLDCRCDPMPTLWERRGWVRSPCLSFCTEGTRYGAGGCLTCGSSPEGSSGSWWHSTFTEIGFSISVDDVWAVSQKFTWIFTYCRRLSTPSPAQHSSCVVQVPSELHTLGFPCHRLDMPMHTHIGLNFSVWLCFCLSSVTQERPEPIRSRSGYALWHFCDLGIISHSLSTEWNQPRGFKWFPCSQG